MHNGEIMSATDELDDASVVVMPNFCIKCVIYLVLRVSDIKVNLKYYQYVQNNF